MKVILKLFMFLTAIVFTVIAVIKVIEGCTWKEAVGIAEELWKELTEPFRYCCANDGDNPAENGA
jgi:hypothetical protein